MNIIELEEILKNNNINASNRLIAKIWGMDEAAYSRKKKIGSEIKQKNIEQIESYYNIAISSNVIKMDCIKIDYYPDVFGSCGSGSFVLSENKESFTVPKKNINNYSSCKEYSVINTIGDSMQPYLHSGDKLIVEHWRGEQIRDNSIYVFRYKDEIFVKRLSKNIDQIIIKSDNPVYDTRKINISDDFQIIGQIVGLMRDLR